MIKTILLLSVLALSAYQVSAGSRILAINNLNKRTAIDDSAQLIGLEDEISGSSWSKTALIKFPSNMEPKQVSTAGRFPDAPVIRIEGDEPDSEEPEWAQLELVSLPFQCNRDNIVTVLGNLKTLAQTLPKWKGDDDDKIEGFPEEVELRNTDQRTAHGCQATIDMKFSLDNIKALYGAKKKWGLSLLSNTISIFEKCIVPTAKATTKVVRSGHEWDTFTVEQKYPLFFKIFQGMMISTKNGNTVKSNESILFKFSYADKNNFIDTATQDTRASSGRAYDLVEEYSQKAKLSDGTYVKDCVNEEVAKISGDKTPWEGQNMSKKMNAETFKNFWATPTRENDPFQNPELEGTGVIHTQVKPKINADHIITQVAFEIRNPNMIAAPENGWPAAESLVSVANDLVSWCTAAWPQSDENEEDGDQIVLAPLDSSED